MMNKVITLLETKKRVDSREMREIVGPEVNVAALIRKLRASGLKIKKELRVIYELE